ncbi:MAG: type II toxin-antitoxin system RelE/ParE family toxin [Pseudomonadota bacterium]
MNDIEEIARYIERDSHFYAASVVTKILQKMSLVKTFPFSGRVVPEEGNENVREHFVFSYRLIYEVRVNIIYVLAVVHGKRMLYPGFENRIKNG